MEKISKAHFQSPVVLTLSKTTFTRADHLTKTKGSLLFSFVVIQNDPPQTHPQVGDDGEITP
jgi:hypothetical protein